RCSHPRLRTTSFMLRRVEPCQPDIAGDHSATGLLLGLLLEIGLGESVVYVAPARIVLREGSRYLVERHVVEAAVFADILHVALAATVKRVVDGIVHPVELQGQKAKAFAQFNVERRRRLTPFPIQEYLGKAMPDE